MKEIETAFALPIERRLGGLQPASEGKMEIV